MHLSEQEIIRREHLEDLRKLGVDPYPAQAFEVNALASDIKAQFTDEAPEQFEAVSLAGRMMVVREKGKVTFAELQDSSGRIQLYISRSDITDGPFNFSICIKYYRATKVATFNKSATDDFSYWYRHRSIVACNTPECTYACSDSAS